VPEVQIAFSNTAPLAGDTVVLEAQRKGAGTQPTAATWTFGDGQTGNGVQTSHQWATARTYQVTVTATFPDGQTAVASQGIQVTARPQLTVTAPANGTVSGGGISCPGTCTATYAPNEPVTLTATPDTGFVFTGWGGACTGRGSCSLTMNGNKNVTATFGARHTLSVSVSGNGSVSGGGINCPGTCSVTVDPGTSIALQANAGSGNGLLNWGGACGNGRNTTCTVQMNNNQSASATFAQLPSVTVTTEGGGGSVAGDVSCGENSTCGPVRFPFGRTVNLRAVLTDANTVNWSGSCNNSGKTCSFNVGTTPGASHSVTVSFFIADPCPPVCGPPAVNSQNVGRAGSRGPLEPARLPDPPDPIPTRRRCRRARPGRG
jgi:predicted outer membrane repeat protein